jgi:dipeptidyl aminopeptidase/acylaminoacyl peptidase
MNAPGSLPYGTWPSPISALAVATQGVRLASVTLDGADLYWIEGRPQESGRHALVRRQPDGRVADVGPADFNARTRVHEYGGGAYVVGGRVVYASSFVDQRIYRLSPDQPSLVVPLTPSGPWRYADAAFDGARRRLIAVREDHGDAGREPVNTLVAIALDGGESAGEIIVSGDDFYSSPRLSPDGRRLCWLAWRHPRMPWDGSDVWVAELSDEGTLHHARHIAGSDAESIYQPGWSAEGELVFASDREGWWRLYRCDVAGSGAIRPVLDDPPARTEFGRPQWVFGTATWTNAGRDRLAVSYTENGRWRLGVVDLRGGRLTEVASGLEPGAWLAADDEAVWLVAASPTAAPAVVRIAQATGRSEVIRSSSAIPLAPADVSVAEPFEFPTADGSRGHAFFYPPRNARAALPSGEHPPLVVVGHGGPTDAASAAFDLKVQFWTSRGFAVVDVNYGGSSGFGRAYRQRLAGQWGIVDVADLAAAAAALVADGRADARRVIVRGGSAGGFTTLAALTWRPDVFTAGASYYGISDLEALASDTHKFESRYLDGLVGRYPAARDIYRARSPVHHVARLSRPLILLQGLEDKVVPPNQSAMMADAVRAKGLPVAYLTFEGEQHGFRKAETIVTSLLAELGFYGKVFGFTPADEIPPLEIANLPR